MISLEQDSAKKAKTSEKVSEEDLKAMMQLVPVEEVYVEALQGRIVENKMLQVIPTASYEDPTANVSTGSDVVPTASTIFTTAIVSTPYSKRKGKEKIVESETPKKQKLQEQIDVQMARKLEKEIERDAQRMNVKSKEDAKIARIHAEEELQIMIDGLDRNNETIAKYLQEYHQFAADLSLGERIEMISDLVKYQDNYAKILKYQSLQRKPLSKKKQREFYMSVLKSHARWKAKHFKGMTQEKIKEKFDPV
nr:hypothetical protein [Tanacetum cinerariifolium]